MSTLGPVHLSLPEGCTLVLPRAAAERVRDQLDTDLRPHEDELQAFANRVGQPRSTPDRITLDADHRMWDRHSGAERRHSGPKWETGDEPLAERTYAQLAPKVRQFSDLLMDHAGEVFTVDDILGALPDVYGSDRAIAGSLNGFRLPCEAAGRRFPFTWWESHPTEYAMHPVVAAIWREGRRRRQGRAHR